MRVHKDIKKRFEQERDKLREMMGGGQWSINDACRSIFHEINKSRGYPENKKEVYGLMPGTGEIVYKNDNFPLLPEEAEESKAPEEEGRN